MDIDDGACSEDSDEEAQKEKMEVLVYRLFTGPTFTCYNCNCFLIFCFNACQS